MEPREEKASIQLKIGCILAATYLCVVFCHDWSPSPEPSVQETPLLTQEEITAHNDSCYEDCYDYIVSAIALTEGFHDEPYHCGAKWTIGYGSTVLENGSRVTENTAPITHKQAKSIVHKHLNKRVRPFLKYVYRPLNINEMLTTCMFVYNIGGTNFSGYTETGKKIGEPSKFLCALNQNLPARECARLLTGFRSSNGKQANGLLKRRWIEGAIYLGIITPEMIPYMKPERFYKDDVSFYYTQNEPSADNYWDFDYSLETVMAFLTKNISNTNNVQSIL